MQKNNGRSSYSHSQQYISVGREPPTMTEPLYLDDSTVREFEARVERVIDDGETSRVVLDSTQFYPEGGGQPADFGTISNAETVPVVDVQKTDEIYHTVEGDGPTAGILSVKPPNLTQLSKKNGGTFPFWEAYATIDGSNEKMQGHGTREMPLWGHRFRAERGSAETWIHGSRGRILSLVHYLESIQVE